MKTQIKILVAAVIIAFAGCSKKENAVPASPASGTADNYSSMKDFFEKNGVHSQYYYVDAVTGGSFTTPKGTTVTIPAHAFITQSGCNVTGNVRIEFKDLYSKSDMLLSDKGTLLYDGRPLLSAGEFFIKAINSTGALLMAPAKKITINQPVDVAPQDTVMQPFFGAQDSVVVINQPAAFNWVPAPVVNTVTYINPFNAPSYVFSLYQFNSPVSSGTWANSDNPTYFSSFQQTTLTIIPNFNPDDYQTDVFLVFKNQKAMVHVYNNFNGSNNFPYAYAPVGLECTVVATGVKGGKLYAGFYPITITANMSMNFSMGPKTTDEFIAKLKSLD